MLAPVAENAGRRFQRFLRGWCTKTVTGWAKPVSRERRFQRFLRAWGTKPVRLWEKPASWRSTTPNVSWSYYLCEQIFFNLFSNLSFIFVRGIVTNKDFSYHTRTGLAIWKTQNQLNNRHRRRICKPYQIINLSQFLTL